MTANDSEHTDERPDTVAEFALWLRQLHRQAGKPSYAQMVRRTRRRYPQATVREGTISEMLNGKRLPRWETVEPVAWALGGETAVAACRQRWIEADTARTPPAPSALEVLEPSRGPEADPVPATGAAPEQAGGSPGEVGAAQGGDVPVRRRWRFAVGGAVVVVSAAVLAYAFLSPDGRHPRPGTSSTGVATSAPSGAAGQKTAGPSPSSSSSSPRPVLTPGTAMLTAHSSRPASTRDGLVTISVLSVGGNNIPGAVYSVITPWITCKVSAGDVGQSVVIKGPSRTWIRLVIIDFPEPKYTDATSTDFDIPIDFQITRGQGTAPRATQPCT